MASTASWFGTRGVAALLTMRVWQVDSKPHPRSGFLLFVMAGRGDGLILRSGVFAASRRISGLWFETRGVAALLTMRVSKLIPVSDVILRSGLLAASRRISGLWFNNAPFVVARLDRAIQYSPPSPEEALVPFIGSTSLRFIGTIGYWVARSSRAMTGGGFGR
jgi:hypothetical protein